MALSKTLFLLLLSLFLQMILANTVHSQLDVTTFQIDSFDPTSDGLTYERDASVPSGEPQKSSVGRVLYTNPINFWAEEGQASFDCTIKLRITPIDDNPADGMAFFIIPVHSTIPTGGEGGNLGIYNAVVAGSPIFSVQFDTFINPDDPDYRHIGININSRSSQKTTSFEDMIGEYMTVCINYDASTGNITVLASSGEKTAAISYVYNLKSLLPQQVQVGLSASTGPGYVAFFDVFAWRFASKMVRPQPDVTSFKIDSFDPTSDGLTYERDAFVPLCSKSLRLVATDESGVPKIESVGRVLYSSPVQLWDEGRRASFVTTIKFLITSVDNVPADGITFFIIPVNSTTPTGGEGRNLGIFDAVTPDAHIFAVEFDTFVNTDDPKFPHIGIDIDSRKSKKDTRFENAIGQIVTARIDYDGPTGMITAYASYGSQTPTVNYAFDLKTILPKQVQVGLSASTGHNIAVFDVFSWSFTSIMVTVYKNNFDVTEDTHIKINVA